MFISNLLTLSQLSTKNIWHFLVLFVEDRRSHIIHMGRLNYYIQNLNYVLTFKKFSCRHS